MRWAGYVARTEEMKNECKTSVGKLKGKSPLGRPKGRYQDIMKMD
jgi:hypothetical protein